MGNFYRCLRCPRLHFLPHANTVRDEFDDELFGSECPSHECEHNSDPFLPCDDDDANPWVDAGCDLRCPACLKHAQQDPLALAAAWLDACVLDAALAVPRFADTALYVAAARILAMVCKAAAERGGVLKLQDVATVGLVYASTLKLLEASWHSAADRHRCRPFLRLQTGRLLQAKLVVELCFRDAFEAPAHAAGLSGLATRVLVALGEGDAEVLWDAVQLLEDPARRASLLGPSSDAHSRAACAVLQLQSLAALLVHPLWPLEVYRCPVEQALSRMSGVLADFTAEAPPQMRWLVGWQLVDCADRAFRHSCHSGSTENDTGVQPSDAESIRHWAVRCAAELALWRLGDPCAGTVALAAIRALILWHRLLSRQHDMSRSSELLSTLARALHRATAHCTNVVDGSAARSEAAAEAKAVMMLLNDHHMAAAPQIAARRPCFLHVHGSDSGPQPVDSPGTLAAQNSQHRLIPATVEISGEKMTVRAAGVGLHGGAEVPCRRAATVDSLPADGAAAFACFEEFPGGSGGALPCSTAGAGA